MALTLPTRGKTQKNGICKEYFAQTKRWDVKFDTLDPRTKFDGEGVSVKSINLLKLDAEGTRKATVTSTDVVELLQHLKGGGAGTLEFVELALFLLGTEDYDEGDRQLSTYLEEQNIGSDVGVCRGVNIADAPSWKMFRCEHSPRPCNHTLLCPACDGLCFMTC
jgi:hypothetical protein